jgi:hypothetical protein
MVLIDRLKAHTGETSDSSSKRPASRDLSQGYSCEQLKTREAYMEGIVMHA